ncbi:MAG: hypothetical protein WCP17_00015 [bacterium]
MNDALACEVRLLEKHLRKRKVTPSEATVLRLKFLDGMIDAVRDKTLVQILPVYQPRKSLHKKFSNIRPDAVAVAK